MPGYLHEGMLLYVRELCDWASYYGLRRGADADVTGACP